MTKKTSFFCMNCPSLSRKTLKSILWYIIEHIECSFSPSDASFCLQLNIFNHTYDNVYSQYETYPFIRVLPLPSSGWSQFSLPTTTTEKLSKDKLILFRIYYRPTMGPTGLTAVLHNNQSIWLFCKIIVRPVGRLVSLEFVQKY